MGEYIKKCKKLNKNSYRYKEFQKIKFSIIVELSVIFNFEMKVKSEGIEKVRVHITGGGNRKRKRE